jgi:hypothetical protein
VTGYSAGTTTGLDYPTVTYDIVTGVRDWAKRYNGPGNGNDAANAVTASSDPKRAVRDGESVGSTTGEDL